MQPSTLILIVGIIVIAVAIFRLLGAEIIEITNFFTIKLFPPKAPSVYVSPFSTLDVVVSADGTISKIQLSLSILRKEDIHFTAWNLRVRNIGTLNFNQYFVQDVRGDRNPVMARNYTPTPTVGQSQVIGVEFEASNGFNFRAGLHHAALSWRTTEGKGAVRLAFNITAADHDFFLAARSLCQEKREPGVISFPLV